MKFKIHHIKNNGKFIYFLIKLFGLGILWLLIEYSNILNDSGLNNLVIENLVNLSSGILSIMKYKMFSENNIVGINGTSGVLIGAPCNALDLIALFLGVLIILPGKLWQKLLFGLIGSVGIHLLNLIRVISLILILNYSPESLEFNHNYTFTLIMYVIIFFGWVLWVKLVDRKIEVSQHRNEQ